MDTPLPRRKTIKQWAASGSAAITSTSSAISRTLTRPLGYIQSNPGEGAEIRAETEFTASLSFGIDQEVLDAFYDLHCEMESVRFLADPLSLLPILCQPQEPIQVKIDYFQEGCSSTSNCRTTLLWDGDTLWVNWLGGHYLGYWPTDPAEFEAAIQRLTLEYGGTGTVTS